MIHFQNISFKIILFVIYPTQYTSTETAIRAEHNR